MTGQASTLFRPSPFAQRDLQAVAGAGFKPQHAEAILADQKRIGFLEVHAENYMGAGGMPHRILTRMREQFPISIHGVGLSIGGEDPLDLNHLERLAMLVERYQPALVSEHLAWSSHDRTYYNDLLPVPYDKDTLDRVVRHVDQVQARLKRMILLENPSTYIAFETSTMRETDFIREIARRTGCGLLLDINNVHVSASNHGYSAERYLSDFPLDKVAEIHLAGHAPDGDAEGGDIASVSSERRRLLIDTHDRPVDEAVWDLFESVLGETGALPTLIEWDEAIPEWAVLRREADRADRILRHYPAEHHAAAE